MFASTEGFDIVVEGLRVLLKSNWVYAENQVGWLKIHLRFCITIKIDFDEGPEFEGKIIIIIIPGWWPSTGSYGVSNDHCIDKTLSCNGSKMVCHCNVWY